MAFVLLRNRQCNEGGGEGDNAVSGDFSGNEIHSLRHSPLESVFKACAGPVYTVFPAPASD